MSNVKNFLINFRPLVVDCGSILTWEKDFYAGICGGVTTLIYLILWLWDPTFLTLIAVLSFILTLADFALPIIIKKFYKDENWSLEKEKRFNEICTEIEKFGSCAGSTFWRIRDTKEKRPVAHFILTTAFLVLLGWFGNSVNNFFLSYLFSLTLVMIPGLHHRGLLNKYLSAVILKFAFLLKGEDSLKKAN